MAELGLTPNVVAERLGWDTAETFSKWRRGVRRISAANAERLADVLACRIDELDPKGERYSTDERGSTTAKPKPKKVRSRAAAPDYLDAMKIWWAELDPADREKVHDFARQLRDERREARKQKAV